VTIDDSGAITAPLASSIIPFNWANTAVFPSATTYRGAIAYSNTNGYMYFADSSGWIQLAKYTDITSGPAGPTGNTGPQGIQGPVGNTGPAGATGNTGPAGATGNTGISISTASIVSGNLIITLSNTSTINTGTVVGTAGATGNTGPQGIQGPAGNTGPQGIQGPAGTAGATTFAALTDVAGLTADKFYLPAITKLTVTASGSSAYLFDQYSGNNPTIYAISGTTIAFDLGTGALSSHPFLVRTSGGSNYNTGLVHVTSAGVVTTESSAQGKTSGTLYWKIPVGTTGNYQYICGNHGSMVGVITIKDISAI
jgi:plastocyanin